MYTSNGKVFSDAEFQFTLNPKTFIDEDDSI